MTEGAQVIVTRVRLAITLRQSAQEVGSGRDVRLVVRYRGQELDVRAGAAAGTVTVSVNGWIGTFDAASAGTHSGVIDEVVPAVEAAVDRANDRVGS